MIWILSDGKSITIIIENIQKFKKIHNFSYNEMRLREAERMHLQPKTHFIGDYIFSSCIEFHSLIFAPLASLGSMIFGHHPWFLLIFTPLPNKPER